jgi:hypothetical protein
MTALPVAAVHPASLQGCRMVRLAEPLYVAVVLLVPRVLGEVSVFSSLDGMVSLVSQVGLPILLVVYFVWRDRLREESLVSDLRDNQKYQREVIMQMMDKGVQAMDRLSEAISRMGDSRKGGGQ